MQSPSTTSERGPRGKYSRLICQGCRSRKIKCMLPTADDLAPLGTPQPVETSCTRCRNFNLECIVERTSLGRPAAKRGPRKERPSHSPSVPPSPLTQTESRWASSELDTLIKLHLLGGVPFGNSNSGTEYDSQHLSQPEKKAIFRSMIDPLFFFSSILANNQSFGVNTPRVISRWDASLPRIISGDFANALDNFLTWHRFFLPYLPSIATLRTRLESDNDDESNSATSLLFALLCLTAIGMTSDVSKAHPELSVNLQLAISHFGQEFLFSPPLHQDSITVALFLAEYHPTALATSQRVAHKAVQSEVYINIAHRVAERLGVLPTSSNSDPRIPITNNLESEEYFLNSLQGLHVYYLDITNGSFVNKPIKSMRAAIECLEPHVEACQRLIQSGQCSAMIIFHVQSTLASYMEMKAALDLKQSWSNGGDLLDIKGMLERECREQIRANTEYLRIASGNRHTEETVASSWVLEMRFLSIYVSISNIALIYATSIRARTQSGTTRDDPELAHEEAIQVNIQVMQCVRGISDANDLQLWKFLDRFGTTMMTSVHNALATFIRCAESLTINGNAFRPPGRLVITEIIRLCKHILENNVWHIKMCGRLSTVFHEQLALFEKSSQLLHDMKLSPWNTSEAAFAEGCLYSASEKIIQGFISIMKGLKESTSDGIWVNEQGPPPELPSDFDLAGEVGPDFLSQEWAWLWPSIEGSETSTSQGSDWLSGMYSLADMES